MQQCDQKPNYVMHFSAQLIQVLLFINLMDKVLQGLTQLVLSCTSTSDYTCLKHLILRGAEESGALILAQHLVKVLTSIIQATVGRVYTFNATKCHRLLELRGLLDSS
jgi:hypothetical protein